MELATAITINNDNNPMRMTVGAWPHTPSIPHSENDFELPVPFNFLLAML